MHPPKMIKLVANMVTKSGRQNMPSHYVRMWVNQILRSGDTTPAAVN